MTHRQFVAIAHYLSVNDLVNEILNNSNYLTQLRKGQQCSENEVMKWLRNGWNTERVLQVNGSLLEATGQSFALQWSFPQAYYSVYAILQALFKTIGRPESTHASVIKKFGSLCEEKKFPESISVYVKGAGKVYSYHNIQKPTHKYHPIALDLNDFGSVQNQVCQSLKSTRDKKIEEYGNDAIGKLKLVTKKNTPKVTLTQSDWNRVSSIIPPTTMLDFLYRKRIKSNYEDTDIFNYAGLKAATIHSNLMEVVNKFNFVYEAYISKAIRNKYEQMVMTYLKQSSHEPLRLRFRKIQELQKAEKS